MRNPRILPFAVIIGIAIIIIISEIIIRSVSSQDQFFLVGDAALFLWGLLMVSGGLFSLLSYFFEARWKGFYALIWVFKNIMPVGGKVNAIIIGIIGILMGIISIMKALSPYLFLAFFFASSINVDNLSISSGLVL